MILIIIMIKIFGIQGFSLREGYRLEQVDFFPWIVWPYP
jgi:hypothetical protein